MDWLARVRSFSRDAANRKIVYDLVHESKWFIEWTAAETEIDTAEQLVALRLELALLQLDRERILGNQAPRAAVACHALAWSDRVPQMSGLLH